MEYHEAQRIKDVEIQLAALQAEMQGMIAENAFYAVENEHPLFILKEFIELKDRIQAVFNTLYSPY